MLTRLSKYVIGIFRLPAAKHKEREIITLKPILQISSLSFWEKNVGLDVRGPTDSLEVLPRMNITSEKPLTRIELIYFHPTECFFF